MNDDNRVTKMHLDAVGLHFGSHQTPGSVKTQCIDEYSLGPPQVNNIVQAAVPPGESVLPSEFWPGTTLLLSSCPDPCRTLCSKQSCWRSTLQPDKLRAVMSWVCLQLEDLRHAHASRPARWGGGG